MIKTLLYIWQLPQHIVGLFLLLILRPESSVDYMTSRLYAAERMRGGISLGQYIIIQSGRGTLNTIKHEYGHSIQSKWLGPLYLIVIGLPSLLWAWWWTPSRGVSYYCFYTEKWADKLGGVNRDNT